MRVLVAMLAAAVMLSAVGETVLFTDAYDTPGVWKMSIWENRFKATCGAELDGQKGLLLTDGAPSKPSADLKASTVALPLKGAKGTLVVSWTYAGNRVPDVHFVAGADPTVVVRFHTKDGSTVLGGATEMDCTKRGDRTDVELRAPIPARAEAFSLRLAVGARQMEGDDYILLGAVKVSAEDGAPRAGTAWSRGYFFADADDFVPELTVVSETPTADRTLPPVLEIRAPSKWNLDTAEFAIDKKPAVFRRAGDFWHYAGPRTPWTDGLHSIAISFRGGTGEVFRTTRSFAVTDRPISDSVRVTIREDGQTLIDGKPYFPIGIFGIKKLPFNGFSYEKAFADLAAAGFDSALTYQAKDDFSDEYIAAAAKAGMRIWGRWSTERVLKVGRHADPYVMWMVGDDTAARWKPHETAQFAANMKAADPTRLTCQTDVMWSGERSSYKPFVQCTDIFMPEAYPFRAGDRPDCVGFVAKSVDRILLDQRAYGRGKRKSCWVLLQDFQGCSLWLGMPTPRQLEAMTYAAVIQGAHGVAYYCYGDRNTFDLQKNKAGVIEPCSSPERWADLCGIVARLRKLVPAIVEPAPIERPFVRIVRGPTRDPSDYCGSVLCRLLRHKGRTCLMAVNATPEKVSAVFDVKGVRAKSAFEKGRVLQIGPEGLADDFEPFATRTYLIEDADAREAQK